MIMKPEFKSQVPEHLLKNASPQEKWITEQLSIQHQQNEWMIDRLTDGDRRFERVEKDLAETRETVAKHEAIRIKLSAKSSIIGYIAAAILGPVCLAFLAALFLRMFELKWK